MVQLRRHNTAANMAEHTDSNETMGCVNAGVCGSRKWTDEETEFNHGQDTCMTCGPWFKVAGFGWGTLDIDSTPMECSVCLHTEPSVKLPQCTHRLCVQCFRDIMLWDECRSHLNPVTYGCPPCPQGCVNPNKGRQCYCDEYDPVRETWECTHPLEFKAYNDAENQSIDTPTDDTYGKAKCPFCRTVYNRKRHGHYTGYAKEKISSHDMCWLCEDTAQKTCAGCHRARYCSRQCQKRHWAAGHKTDCKTFAERPT